jgi:hypothetical protein
MLINKTVAKGRSNRDGPDVLRLSRHQFGIVSFSASILSVDTWWEGTGDDAKFSVKAKAAMAALQVTISFMIVTPQHCSRPCIK